MKTNHLLSILLASAALAGCAKEMMLEPEVKKTDGQIPITFTGSINQEQTKVTVAGFENKDAVGLFAVNYTDNNATAGTLAVDGNQADNVKYVFNESAGKWVPARSVYYKDINTHVDLYLYYPYQSSISNVTEYPFEVQKDQSKDAGLTSLSGYEASDFLWGKTTDVTPVESAVGITLTHRLSCVEVELTEGTGFEGGEFDSLSKSLILTNTTRKATINFSTGDATPVGEAQQDGIVMCPQQNGTFRAIVVPQNVAPSTKLFAITIDGVSYGFKQSNTIEYQAGKQLKVTINVNKKTPSGDYEFTLVESQIVDWTEDNSIHSDEARQYVVVNVQTPGELGKSIRALNLNPDKVKNLKVTGQITTSDFYFMRDSMAILQALNIKEVKIKNAHHHSIQEYDYDNDCMREVEPEGYKDDIIPNDALSGKSTLYHCTIPEDITYIGHSAFSGTKITGALIIPDNVTYICDNAFNGVLATSISLPANLVFLGDGAFYGCSYMSGTLSLPQGIKYIGRNAFRGCKGFSGQLNLSNSIEYLGGSAFCNAGTFTGSIRIPDKVKSISTDHIRGLFNIKGSIDLNNVQKLSGAVFTGVPYEGHSCNISGELILPDNIEIENPYGHNAGWYGCFAYNRITSIVFPSSMTSIPTDCFAGNPICEPLEFNDGLIEIKRYAFGGCNFLPSIHLPKTLEVIGDEAFSGCYGLSSIICDNPEPPQLGSGVFDGVPKDNFTLEVPEGSVAKYRAANGWGDFKRIAAHHEFSISRDHFKALNAETSSTYTLRCPANYTWSIESKPDWVSVSPASGTGKTDVTVTVSELAKGSENREGDLIFLLDGKDYNSTMKVSQYNYQYGDGDVATLYSKSKGNGVNIVLMGDCYDASDIASGDYLANLTDAYEWMFNIEPYKSYKEYFNVYAVFGVSKDSGMGTVNTVKDAKFGSQYTIDAGVAPDHAACFQYACKAPIDNNVAQTLIILVENSTEYGGVCYMYGDGSAIAVCPISSDAYPFDFRGIVQHEAGGHGFAKLGDEYIYTNAFISACDCNNPHLDAFNAAKARGWYPNLESTGDINAVGWSHLIYQPQYSNYVDVFEGGYFHTRGIFRSEATSCMNNNIPYYSAISRQAIVEKIMQYAGETFSLDDFYSKDTDAFGDKTKAMMSAPGFGIPFDFMNGKQREPVYMGEHPQFNIEK